MAIAFKGHVTGSTTNGGNITLNLAAPTSGVAPAAGDVVLAVSCSFARAGNEGRIGNALSYTSVNDFNSTTRRHRVAWKAWASGQNSVVVEGSANASDGTAAVAVWFSGVDITNPFSVTNTQVTGNSTNPNPPAIVPADNNCAIVVLAGSGANDAAPGTVTNYTVLSGVTGNDTNPDSAAVAYRILSGGNGVSEDPAAFSAWVTGNWGVVTAALQEAATIITGTLNITEAADTISAAGSSTLIATLGLTEANDTISAAGSSTVVGTLSVTEAEDTISATGTVGDPTVTGALNITEANDTIVATGGPVARGTLAITEANDIITATATVVVRGTLAITEANDTVTATGGPVVRGTLAVTEANNSITATATVVVRGTLGVTEANDTLAAAGGPIVIGALDVTEAADTLAGTAVVISGISGVLDVTEADDTLAAAGASIVAGTFSATEANDILVAVGEVVEAGITGTLNVVQDVQTLEATGFVEPLTEVTGALVITQNDQTLSAAAHANQFIKQDFLAEPDFVIRPESRFFEVFGERREVEVLADVCYTAIPAEDKILVVPGEDRVIGVPGEIWRVVVPAENRLLVVSGEDRTINIPGEWRTSDVVGIEATYGRRQAALDSQLRLLAR